MTFLNCMTSTDKTRPIEKLFGGAVKTEYIMCGDGAIGEMVQLAGWCNRERIMTRL